MISLKQTIDNGESEDFSSGLDFRSDASLWFDGTSFIRVQVKFKLGHVAVVSGMAHLSRKSTKWAR